MLRLIEDHNFKLIRRNTSVQMTNELRPVKFIYIYKLARILRDDGELLYNATALVTMKLDIMKALIADSYTGKIEKFDMLVPDKEYIVIMCETADDWEEMKEQLNLPQVRRGGYKSGSAFDSIGTQRVLQWAELRSMLADDICDTIEG